MTDRLQEVGEILSLARQTFEECGAVFKRMAAVSLARNKLDEFLEAIYPRSPAQKITGARPEKWVMVSKLLDESADLQLKGVRGTIWGAYNAVTHFEDYRQTRTPEDTDARLNRVWFGSGADAKLRALTAARQLATA